MESLKVSIIIPVYNTAEYVGEAIKCITNQTLTELEIIVIDDGSTDNSYQVVKTLAEKDDRIKIYRQRNMGQSEARNFGIKLAQGEYLYFMDSDDLLDTTTFSACFEVSKKDDLDLLFFDAEVFGIPDNTLNLNYSRSHLIKAGIYSGPDMLSMLLKTGAYRASPCLSFIRSSYLKEIQLTFYPGIIHEDELFTFLLIIHARKTGFIKEPFFKRRIRNNSTMSAKFSKKNMAGYMIVFNQLKEFKRSVKDESLQSLVDTRLTTMLESLLYNARHMKAGERYSFLIHCLLHYPDSVQLKSAVLLAFPWVSKFKSMKANS